MLLLYLRTLYCKTRMVAYVNGELPPAARRRMARYIERYPTCYAEYIRQREAARELNFRMPLVGQPEKAALDRIWAAVQSELDTGSQPASNLPASNLPANQSDTLLKQPLLRRDWRRESKAFRVRYGVVGLVMAMAVALPLTFGANHTAFAVSLTQPIPMTATGQPTEDKEAPVLIANNNSLQSVRETPTLPAPAMPQATMVVTVTEEK